MPKSDMTRRRLSFFLFLMLIWASCVPYVRSPRKDNLLRIAIVCAAESVSISNIKDQTADHIQRITVQSDLPRYIAGENGYIIVNQKKYRGDLKIQLNSGKLWVINVVKMEDYLKGVVPCEIGRISPDLLEAAKAQAVAARTYAWAHLNQYEDLGFDLYASIRDQVYKGISCENELTNQAIEQTKGQILTYKGIPIEAKYHSTCGGRTADFNDAWPGDPPPYLKSVRCNYCSKSPHFEWEKIIDKKNFFHLIRNKLASIKSALPADELITNIKLIKNRKSKRVLKFIIITKKNEYPIPGYYLRTLFGYKNDPGGLLKSNYIDLEVKGDDIIIKGKGWGHGVGMCQFGALEMARQGKNYKRILYHYYSNTKIKTIR
jgi:stage II sporulation protein D